MGGGVVATLCHPLDYLRWLIGEINTVQAACGRVSGLEINVEDYADILLGFRRGGTGSVHLDYFQQPPGYRFEIIGSSGTIQWDEERNAARIFRPDQGKWEVFDPPPGFERNHLFLEEMRHFLSVVKGEEEPAASLSDGIRNLEIIHAVHQASMTGQKVTMP